MCPKWMASELESNQNQWPWVWPFKVIWGQISQHQSKAQIWFPIGVQYILNVSHWYFPRYRDLKVQWPLTSSGVTNALIDLKLNRAHPWRISYYHPSIVFFFRNANLFFGDANVYFRKGNIYFDTMQMYFLERQIYILKSPKTTKLE